MLELIIILSIIAVVVIHRLLSRLNSYIFKKTGKFYHLQGKWTLLVIFSLVFLALYGIGTLLIPDFTVFITSTVGGAIILLFGMLVAAFPFLG